MPMLIPVSEQLTPVAVLERRAELVTEHDDLDCAISALLAAPTCDELLIRRLKKRKLHLKDAIALQPVAEEAPVREGRALGQ